MIVLLSILFALILAACLIAVLFGDELNDR
jgi:hypothetical protein